MQIDLEDEELAWLTKVVGDRKVIDEAMLRGARIDKSTKQNTTMDLRMAKSVLNKLIG